MLLTISPKDHIGGIATENNIRPLGSTYFIAVAIRKHNYDRQLRQHMSAYPLPIPISRPKISAQKKWLKLIGICDIVC